MTNKRLALRGIVSLVLIALLALFNNLWSAFAPAYRAAASVGQLSNSNEGYGMANLLASDWVSTIVFGVVVAMLVFLWAGPVMHLLRRKGVLPGMISIIVLLTSTACGTYSRFEEIGPNETAFLIPLTGANKDSQGKFESEEFLLEKKIAAKRVEIQRVRLNDKAMAFAFGSVVDAERLIKVDRKPVTREWVKASDRGTSKKDESISAESNESIDFYSGVAASASILEQDAHKFLYWYGGKSLAEVMDEDVRPYIQGVLSSEFNSRRLSEILNKRKEIFQITYEAARDTFKAKGVTIAYISSTEGLTYKDPKIQETINQVFAAQQDVEKTRQQLSSQENLKQVEISKAEAVAEGIKRKGEADAYALAVKGEQLKNNPQLVALTVAEHYQGGVPLSYSSGEGGSTNNVVTIPLNTNVDGTTGSPPQSSTPRPTTPAR